MEALGASPASEERGPGKRNKGWGECSALTLLLELKSEGKIQINRLTGALGLCGFPPLPSPRHRAPPPPRLGASLVSPEWHDAGPTSPSEFSEHLFSCTNPPGGVSGLMLPLPLVCLPSQTSVSVPSSPLGSTWCQSLRKRILSCPQTPGLMKNKAQSTSQYVLSNNFFVFNIN